MTRFNNWATRRGAGAGVTDASTMERRSYHYDDNRFIRIFYYYCYCYYVTQRSPLRNDIFCKHYFRALIFIASPSPRECHLFLSFSFESILDDVARSSPTVRSSYAPFPPQPMLLDPSNSLRDENLSRRRSTLFEIVAKSSTFVPLCHVFHQTNPFRSAVENK